MFGLGHILVVEDNADLRGALAMLLESEGHQVIEAADGRLASVSPHARRAPTSSASRSADLSSEPEVRCNTRNVMSAMHASAGSQMFTRPPERVSPPRPCCAPFPGR